MPNIASAKKNMRKSRAATVRNRAQRSALRTALKKAKTPGASADDCGSLPGRAGCGRNQARALDAGWLRRPQVMNRLRDGVPWKSTVGVFCFHTHDQKARPPAERGDSEGRVADQVGDIDAHLTVEPSEVCGDGVPVVRDVGDPVGPTKCYLHRKNKRSPCTSAFARLLRSSRLPRRGRPPR